MSNKGVCRTAPATPGLLNILEDDHKHEGITATTIPGLVKSY